MTTPRASYSIVRDHRRLIPNFTLPYQVDLICINRSASWKMLIHGCLTASRQPLCRAVGGLLNHAALNDRAALSFGIEWSTIAEREMASYEFRYVRHKFVTLLTISLLGLLVFIFSSDQNLHFLQTYDTLPDSDRNRFWPDSDEEGDSKMGENEFAELTQDTATTAYTSTTAAMATTLTTERSDQEEQKATDEDSGLEPDDSDSDMVDGLPDQEEEDPGKVSKKLANVNGAKSNRSKPGDSEHKGLTKKTRLIILWSERPDTDHIRWWDLAQTGSEEFEKCKWSNCELSRDRSRVREASVIVFRHHDPYPEWPEIRFPNQSYVHMLNERPNPGHWWLAKFDDRINITWNYRKDADVSHHKIVVEKEKPSNARYVPRIPFSNKTRSIMWAVSHCKTYCRREEYATELAKYIDLDIFGGCGTLECSREYAENCTDLWEQQYKFHLSFENSVCPDYITEKFYRPLERELIPVVLGGGDYKTAGPPHSYIDVRDYESPKELAKYLRYLANNEQKYNEYFQWKQKDRETTFQDVNSRLYMSTDVIKLRRSWSEEDTTNETR
ncbi:hypothetical protein LSH36_1166g00062 [Paralvinella palmiformis]|uniref:Fucosyltransferase n=1 Tax=Paralvinella palmiformis TaxID=53620 RepID=A0AAD9MRF0_9ANNE|nr:hypothetical protein LSH36_1166g00062 [Paralvinella palmiformis]